MQKYRLYYTKNLEKYYCIKLKIHNKNLKEIGDNWRNFETSLRKILKNVLCSLKLLQQFFFAGAFFPLYCPYSFSETSTEV